jgi:hypothetical protein
MPTDFENVLKPGKTGSGQRTVKATRLPLGGGPLRCGPFSFGRQWLGLAAYDAPIASARQDDWPAGRSLSGRGSAPMLTSLRQRPSKVCDTKIYGGPAVLRSRVGVGLAVL